MFTLNTLLNIKIFNSLIPFLFLTVVIACNNSATIEGGNVLERTSDNNSQNAIEEDGNTKKVLKKIIHRVMSDSGKLGMGNVIFSESYDSLGNKLTQYERFDNYYISWTYVNASKDEKGFKRGFDEIDGEKHCLNKECEYGGKDGCLEDIFVIEYKYY